MLGIKDSGIIGIKNRSGIIGIKNRRPTNGRDMQTQESTSVRHVAHDVLLY